MPLVAQEPKATTNGPATEKNKDVNATLTLGEVESKLAAIESDPGIDDVVKNQLQSIYTQAIEALREADNNTARVAEYRESMMDVAESVAGFQAQLRALPTIADVSQVGQTGNANKLKQEVERQRAVATELTDERSRISSELTRLLGRPAEISVRLPEVQRELSEINAAFAAPEIAAAASPRRIANRVLLQARQKQLSSELEMLKQEQLSQSAREERLVARKELLARQVENAVAVLKAQERLFQQSLANKSRRLSERVENLLRELPPDDQTAIQMAAEMQELAKEYEVVVLSLKKVNAAREKVKTQSNDLKAEFESIRQQVKLSGGGMAMVQLLYSLQSRALNAPDEMRMLRLSSLEELRLGSLQVHQKLRDQSVLERQLPESSTDAARELITWRHDVLKELRGHYSALFSAVSTLEGDKTLYLDKAAEVRKYVSDRLFGFDMRSCPPIGLSTLKETPEGLRWCFAATHWREFGHALSSIFRRMPMRCLGVILVAVALLLMRRRFGAALETTGVQIRRISTDRYIHTLKALLWTFLLCAPTLIIFGFFAWALGQAPAPSDWLRGLDWGLWMTTPLASYTAFLMVVCRPNGLGAAHFGWNKETLARIRSAIKLFAIVYFPALVLITSFAYGNAAKYFPSVARMSFLVAHIWITIVYWRLLVAPNGILASLSSGDTQKFVASLRRSFFLLLLLCPSALMALACMGYLITATQFSIGLMTTVILIAEGKIVYGLALRWFMIKERRLAFAEKLEERRERQEANAAEEYAEASEEILTVDPDENELDLDSISEQTRTLLRVLYVLGVGMAVIIFWSQSFPLIELLGSILLPFTESFSILELLQIGLLLTVTFFVVQNLPGLLELAFLRATSIEVGTRNAITTLCQYGVIAVGLSLVLGVVHVDWAQFGWLAAALSVGLGFGLQEVVANFVCGLILLFERPIRVGDVVTIDGVTGTVTSMQIRATIITNWDRGEVVVPNKTLITNKIVNWTLSTPLNRVVIPVGVAYGSDTEQARQILLDVAADHPNILTDPGPTAIFEQFADSSLNLVMRAYLPDRASREGTITELHTEIKKRFASAGIEIPFPQRDLNLRSGWEHTSPMSGLEAPALHDQPSHSR
ncbi:mechanosensitive ion channel domain-containing protein [Symmachiella macrocystis]|nr:mechanosensitive ion channel domain-containing protein [Symmachiella macrocystis]